MGIVLWLWSNPYSIYLRGTIADKRLKCQVLDVISSPKINPPHPPPPLFNNIREWEGFVLGEGIRRNDARMFLIAYGKFQSDGS